jgi:hypothetical protein
MKAHTIGLATLISGALISGALIVGTAATSTAASQGSAAAATATKQARITLAPSSQQLARCFPKAKARVKVDLTTNSKGFDTFTIAASGLKPRTDFTVFLLEQSGAPFGAAEYIGDFTTDKRGNATNAFKLIVEEAFAFNNATGTRTDLNAIGVWFADEKDDDGCLGSNSPVTGFDGDGKAGVQMLNSGTTLLP